MKHCDIIELKFEPIYKIPEGYHVDIAGDTIMLAKDEWKPMKGEVYYEPIATHFKPVKRICWGEDLGKRRVYKTLSECRKHCRWHNDRIKMWFDNLKD